MSVYLFDAIIEVKAEEDDSRIDLSLISCIKFQLIIRYYEILSYF